MVKMNHPFDLDGILTKHLEAYRAEVTERGVLGEEDPEFLIAEQSALIEGLVRGWVKVRLPRILEEYTVVSVEEEMEWEMAPGIIQMLRLDGLLRHKGNGLLYILEFKTASQTGYSWQLGWEKNIQFMSYTQAVREITGEECGGVIVEGLVKGQRRKETSASSPFSGRTLQNSPFCYGYATTVKGTDFDVVLDVSWSRGSRKVLIPFVMPLKAWVEELHSSGLLSEQFVSVPPTNPLPKQILRWRRQTIAGETRFMMALAEVQENDALLAQAREEGKQRIVAALIDRREELLDFHFPQHDNHCHRYFGSCGFMEACFEEDVAEDPIGSGLYQVREPHHTTEVTQE
jgi:hypothetical protein